MKRSRLDSVIGKPPVSARWFGFKYFPHGEGTIDGRAMAVRIKRFFESPDVDKVSRETVRGIETGIETMMLCAGMAPQNPADVPWHIQYLAANQFVQDFHAERILPTDDTLIRFSSIVFAERVVEQALDAWEGGPETVTARRLAVLLEAPETPPVVRELLGHMCHTLDAFSAVPSGRGGDLLPQDYRFKGSGTPAPAVIRRKLPAMLRKVGDWHVLPGLMEIAASAEKGGAQ